MKSKHTPGLWTFRFRAPGTVVETADSGEGIALVASTPEHGDMHANARLIAASPELLAALEAVLPAIRWGSTHQPGNMNQWRQCEAEILAAIAKATA